MWIGTVCASISLAAKQNSWTGPRKLSQNLSGWLWEPTGLERVAGVKRPRRLAAPAGTQDPRSPASPGAPPLGRVSELACSLGGVVHVSGPVPGGWAGRSWLSSPTGKTRFSWIRRRPGGNRLVTPLGAFQAPEPPFPPRPCLQPPRLAHLSRGDRGNVDQQLGKPEVTRSHAGHAHRSRLGSAWGPPALPPRILSEGGERERPRGRECQTGAEDRMSRTQPSSSWGRTEPPRSCPLPIPPERSRKVFRSCSAQATPVGDKNLERRLCW